MLIWRSANHDDRQYQDPERFDITRGITKHLAFGHGIHYCLGANLARLEPHVAFDEWHARFPEYELDGTPRRITSIWARAFGEGSRAYRLTRLLDSVVAVGHRTRRVDRMHLRWPSSETSFCRSQTGLNVSKCETRAPCWERKGESSP